MGTAYAGSMTTAARPEVGGTSRRPSLLPLGLLAAAVAALAAGWSGAAAPLALADPGPLVRWGIPAVEAIATISASVTIGLLGMAVFIVPERARTTRRIDAARLAGMTAAVWTVAATLRVLLVFADLAGMPLTSDGFLQQFFRFVWELETTRVYLLNAILALVVSLGALRARGRSAMGWALTAALTAVLILALIGHAAGAASHETAVNALAVHLLGVVVWVGGLAGLAVLRPTLGADLPVSLSRYSTLALWSFVAVTLTGAQQAWIRVGSLAALGTSYGLIVVAKTLALVALGVFGWTYRRRVIAAIGSDPGSRALFARLVIAELAVMGLATGLSAALGRTAPAVPDVPAPPSRVLELTGYPDPGAPGDLAWLTAWRFDWLFLATALLAVGLYVVGFVTLRRRGDDWPVTRLIAWVAGWFVFVYATCGAPGIWGRVLFSWHMVMHMAVAMIVPLFLVPGAPVTLLLRAIHPRPDKTWGPREFLLQVVHSRAMRFFANPVVAAVFFFVSLAAFYWSPLFEIALTTHTGHLLMMAHFLLTGYLFTWVLIGIDPGVPRWSPLMLLVILFATISFHAFFGVTLTSATELLAHDFFTQLQLPWGPSPLADQYTAGEIAWGVGEFPTLVLAIIVARQWVRTDAVESRRLDRQADRDGDAELNAYNDYLARLRERTEHEQ